MSVMMMINDDVDIGGIGEDAMLRRKKGEKPLSDWLADQTLLGTILIGKLAER